MEIICKGVQEDAQVIKSNGEELEYTHRQAYRVEGAHVIESNGETL